MYVAVCGKNQAAKIGRSEAAWYRDMPQKILIIIQVEAKSVRSEVRYPIASKRGFLNGKRVRDSKFRPKLLLHGIISNTILWHCILKSRVASFSLKNHGRCDLIICWTEVWTNLRCLLFRLECLKFMPAGNSGCLHEVVKPALLV
jgi:hypothetical protein